MPDQFQFLKRHDGESIAYLSQQGGNKDAGIIFLSGFRSDMSGTKAQALADWAAEKRRNFIRFDYFGHGSSSGDFVNGTIGRWRDDTLAVIDELTTGPQILVGSSMGGWLALLAAKKRPERVQALVLVAPAPDFTQKLMWENFTPEIRDTILTKGVWHQPSLYSDEPTPITRMLIEDGREHLLLDEDFHFDGPVRILQGMNDPDVPWRHAVTLMERITSTDIELQLIKNGDHRLSTPHDLSLLVKAVETIG